MNNKYRMYLVVLLFAVFPTCVYADNKLHYKELLVNEEPLIICKEIKKDNNKSQFVLHRAARLSQEALIADMMLFAAEITVDNGYKYFVFVNVADCESDLKEFRAVQFDIEFWNDNNIEEIRKYYKTKGIQQKIEVYPASELINEIKNALKESFKKQNMRYKY
jgi:hypothetical protein